MDLVLKRRPSLKDVHTQRGREKSLSSADICEQGSKDKGFFRCGRPHFLVQKTSDFSKFMVCLHGRTDKGGRENGS